MQEGGAPKTARNTSRSAGRVGHAPRPRLDLEFSERLFVAFWPSKSKWPDAGFTSTTTMINADGETCVSQS